MLEYLSISKRNPEFPNYLDFQTLRDIGIKHLQILSGKLWTDYNLHDPGVTILEVLCYAVTDLGYRNNLDIQDLLALNPADVNSRENNFFTPDEILTCNPVTELDIRRRLIDIPGVRNAWLEKVMPETATYNPAIYIDYASSKLQYNPPTAQIWWLAILKGSKNFAFLLLWIWIWYVSPRLYLRGLYTVYIDLDLEYRKNACGQIERSWSNTLDQVKAVLCKHRNLCEDVYDIMVLGEEEIGLCGDIELEVDADAEDVLVEIYVRIQAFLSPRLQFYTLQELLDKGKSITEIFAGRPSFLHNQKIQPQPVNADKVYDSHGFIDTAELEALTLPTIIYTSDLYQEILKVPGVAAVRKLNITNYIDGLAQSQHPWHLHLTKGYSPVLGIEYSKIKLFKGAFPISTNMDEVKRRYYEQQAAHIKVFRRDNELDLTVPTGSYYHLADHYSIQHDFPLTYGISEEGLPETASALRQAQARQLKGYLVFFDQLLANYFAQLAHVRDLFSWEVDEAKRQQNDHVTRQQDKWHTYFTQELDFPDKPAILGEGGEYLKSIQEEAEAYRDRRNRFLDHLLGRFAESFSDYVLLNYQIIDEQRDKVKDEIEIIHDKAQFLQDYPFLSRDRFRAFNYCDCKQVWDTENVSGFKKRVSRLLGFEDVRRRHLCPYRIAPGGWIISFSGSSDNIFLESKQVYVTREQAQEDLEKLLLFAIHPDFYYKRLFYHYDNAYGYVLVDNKGKVLAESTERLATIEERETALQRWFSNIQVNQNQFKFKVEQANKGYFITLKNNTGEQTLLQGLKSYPTAVLAWQSAGAFAENLRYLNRYVSPVKDKAGNNYSLGIVDQSGKLLAIAATESNPFETFKLLNSVEPFLKIRAVTAQTSDHPFELVDRRGATLLYGTQLVDSDYEIIRNHFYKNVLGVLFEPGAIDLTVTEDGFGFRVLSRPRDQKSEVAIHPKIYKTAAERDAAINQLFLLVCTARLNTKIEQHYIGQIYGQDEQILLQSKHYYDNMEDAWQHGNILVEIAQNSSNFNLIDADKLFGWELRGKDTQQILATQYYTSELNRQQALEALQTCVNDEGFHLLEHILLRPKTTSDYFLPICVRDDSTIVEKQPRLTCQDPYSFWISVILPYWPERFRNIDFRRFVERTLRLEAPAHVALKIAWLDVRQMREFEVAYREWLTQLALDACCGGACNLTEKLNRLVAIIRELRSVYPQGTLYDPETSTTNQSIILNQTALGTVND